VGIDQRSEMGAVLILVELIGRSIKSLDDTAHGPGVDIDGALAHVPKLEHVEMLLVLSVETALVLGEYGRFLVGQSRKWDRGGNRVTSLTLCSSPLPQSGSVQQSKLVISLDNS